MAGDANLGTAYAIGDDHLQILLQVAYHAEGFLTGEVGDSWLKLGIYDPLTPPILGQFLDGKYE